MRSVLRTFGVALFGCTLLALLAASPGLFLLTKVAAAAELASRSIEISNSASGATNVTYRAAFTLATAGAIGSISIEFCSNSPLLTDSCTAPNGLDTSGAVLTAQTGATGFSISGSSTANDIILTRPSVVSSAIAASYTFESITNPSSSGPFYGRIQTYASSGASGPATDTGGVAMALNTVVDVSATVPPYLLFCSGNTIAAFDCNTAAGNYLDLGDLSAAHANAGTSQLLVATNGQGGYGISVSGTTLVSGNNIIPELTGTTPSQPGASQFGINLRANSNPLVGSNPFGPGVGIPVNGYDTTNAFKYHSGDVIASSATADDYRKYTVSYMVNITAGQPVGIYASTFTYVATANF